MFHENLALEEYIDLIRDHTFNDPFLYEHDGILYEIYFVGDTEIPIPLNSDFDISGNNVDGFIVTVNRLEPNPSEVTDVSI